MRVLVCGSRDWPYPESIRNELKGLVRVSNGPVEVIHGAARGADQMAAEVAESLGLDVRAFPADWKTHGKVAGIVRNRQMLDEDPNIVVAFQRNGSRGTQHTIDEARRRRIAVKVFRA